MRTVYRVVKASNSEVYYHDEIYDVGMEYTQYSSFSDLVNHEFTALDDKSKDRYVEGADNTLKKYGLNAYSYTALSFETGMESLDVVVGNGKAVTVDVDWDAVNSDEWYEHGTDNVVVEDVGSVFKRLLNDKYTDESNKEFVEAVMSVVKRYM